MLKHTTKDQQLTVSPLRQIIDGPARRLIVPIQNPDMDLTAVTRRIWDLAETTDAHIQFFGLCQDAALEPSLRRALVTMAAMLNYDRVTADSEIIFGGEWVATLQSRLQPGDMLICWDEPSAVPFQKTLRQVLQSNLDIPLYLISGDPRTNQRADQSWITSIVGWVGFLTIILGFLLLQITIIRTTSRWETPLILLSTAAELGLIMLWNNTNRK
jgi:hypothetical protein